jgi:Uri superfamily endonuclease
MGAGPSKAMKASTPTRERRPVPDSGTYVLVLSLPQSQRIRIGKLGVFKFPGGYYLYIGSAMRGLSARIARHLGEKTKSFWHIDHFLPHALVVHGWVDTSGKRLECLWAGAALAMPNARVIAPRFGASDCKCATHLIYFGQSLTEFSLDREKNAT